MRKLSEAEIPNINYGDAALVSLTWRGDDKEPTFVVTFNRGEGAAQRTIVLAFSWPEIHIELNSKHGFTPFSCEGGNDRYYQRLDNGRWKITLDFAHQGAIHVTCNDIFREES